MATDHLESLGIAERSARRAFEFLAAYARTAEEEAGAAGLGVRASEQSAWVPTMEAATAYREAGQAALLIGVDDALSLLAHAGDLYLRADQAYGCFLLALTGQWSRDAPLDRIASMIDDLEAIHGLADGPAVSQVATPALHIAQQQAYALVAFAGSPPARNGFGEVLRRLATESPHRSGVVPVGALGVPIRHIWDVAAHLLRRGDRDVEPVIRQVVRLASSYSEVVDLARVNDYLWRHFASPIEVADLDIIGITALAVRRYGRAAVVRALDEYDLSPVERVPIELGVDVGEGPPDDLWRQSGMRPGAPHGSPGAGDRPLPEPAGPSLAGTVSEPEPSWRPRTTE